MRDHKLEFRDNLERDYADVFTPEAKAALTALAGFDHDRRAVMEARIQRRAARAQKGERIGFLDPEAVILQIPIKVLDAREGMFIGSEIPADLERQWIQGTGPGAKPNTSVEKSIRNVAYALLSGADGWMFDGEDALGQVSTIDAENPVPSAHRTCRSSRWSPRARKILVVKSSCFFQSSMIRRPKKPCAHSFI